MNKRILATVVACLAVGAAPVVVTPLLATAPAATPAPTTAPAATPVPTTAPSAAPRLTTAPAARFEESWTDDFGGPAGSKPDSGKWSYDLGSGEVWGNHEAQTYTGSTDNVAMDGNGNLVITARKEGSQYTSGRIKTEGKFSQKYGKFEARIRIPRGPGLVPAFWAMGDHDKWPDNGEINIMENVGGEPGTVYGTIHGPGYSGKDTTGRGGNSSLPAGKLLSAGFHLFTVESTPNLIVWKLDNAEYHRVTPKNIPAGARWAFDQPFYLLLNIAVGGDWSGPPVDSALPATMTIDFVKVYRYNPGRP